MGGIRTIDGQLVWSPSDKESYVIKHSGNLGIPIVNTQSTTKLSPNTYYNFGTVSKEVFIAQFESKNTDLLESYRGEFTVAEGGYVQFPGTVRWEKDPIFEPGYTYQFRIENNIGTFVKVKA